MTDTTRIRLVEAADFERWFPLWEGYQAFYKVNIARPVTEHTWQRMLDGSEPMHAAVAERDGQLVGFVHYIFHRSTWTQGDYCYLQDLYVDRTVRNGGLGRQLIEHVYGQAAERGASRVYWLTHESNETAMKLYDKVADRPGFVQYRRQMA